MVIFISPLSGRCKVGMTRYKDLSDKDLVALLKQSDEQALSMLYFRYWDKLLITAAQRLDSSEEAEEIVQDIFINLWDRRKVIELTHSLATYLAVAVKYRVINRMDKQHRQRIRENTSSLNTSYLDASPEELLLEKELFSLIESSIKQLPEKCRLVYRMSREEGKTYKQIAQTLDISESTVEKQVSKALKAVRSQVSSVPAPFMFLYLLNQYLK